MTKDEAFNELSLLANYARYGVRKSTANLDYADSIAPKEAVERAIAALQTWASSREEI